MQAKTIMVQGTASSVGKSVLVAALCRIFRQDGYRVAPFKSQNMALNAFVTRDGGEMGRAQVVQAEAAGVEPSVDMNPILLKPEGDSRCQVIVMGRPAGVYSAGKYQQSKLGLWPVVTEALARLRAEYELVVIEGAGSPAEINLRESDIVNMRVAKAAQAPVLLVGDIDRGGVFAHLVGTLDLLPQEERELVRGFIINKFRGDLSLLKPGLRFLEEHTKVPVVGVVPYFHDIRISEEDSVALERRKDAPPLGQALSSEEAIDIAVIRLPRISNFDDFDPLEDEAGVQVRYVSHPDELGQPDLIILPGTKATIADLLHIKERGLAPRIAERAAAGTPIIGICGGYQILGKRICDPHHVEASLEEVESLGILPVSTVFSPHKQTHQVEGTVEGNQGLLSLAHGLEVKGYEIHSGVTSLDGVMPAFMITRRSGRAVQDSDGAMEGKGLVLGTYIHGIFDNTAFRRAILEFLAQGKGIPFPRGEPIPSRQAHYDRLADLVRDSLDMELVYRICGLPGIK